MTSYYRISAVPRKGEGLKATRAIPLGTLILSEKPLFLTTSLLGIGGPNLLTIEDRLRWKIEASRSAEDLNAIRALSSQQGESYYFGRVRRHGIPTTGWASSFYHDDAKQIGIFWELSKVNHSCKANAHESWNLGLGKVMLHASRDTSEGEEISISYLAEKWRRHHEDRNEFEYLEKTLGFRCVCPVHSYPKREFARWAIRLEGIGLSQEYHERYGCKLGHLMMIMETYARNNIFDVRMARVYDDAITAPVFYADTARVLVFEQRGYELYLKLAGEDAVKTVKLKQVLDDPTTHQWWCSRKGFSGAAVREDDPMGLNEKAFEEWLWDAEGPDWREPGQEA